MTTTYADPRTVLVEGRRRLRQCNTTIVTVMRVLDVSVVALSDVLDMGRTTLRSRLAGGSSFEQPEIDAISVALDVPADILLGDAADAMRWLADRPLPPAGATPLARFRSERRARPRPNRGSSCLIQFPAQRNESGAQKSAA